MSRKREPSSFRTKDGILYLSGKITKYTIPELWAEKERYQEYSTLERIDLSEVKVLDSAGVLFIEELVERIKKSNPALGDKPAEELLINYSDQIGYSLKIFSQRSLPEPVEKEKIGFFESLGGSYFEIRDAVYEFLLLSADVFYWSIIGLVKKRGARKGSLIHQSVLIGVDAVPIVFTLSFVIGLIVALQSAAQLRLFGANIFIADLMSIAMVREMGPLITAIIISGRSGSSIASEIATMKVTEELDALKMMAINPIRYVVVPKFHAITICMPLLVMISMLIGILGGIIISVVYLNLSFSAFYNQMLNALMFKDLVISLVKSTCFAWAIVIIGSFYGFRVEGGAEGVGRATTLSVVTSIFAVVFIDVIFSFFYLPK